MDYFSMGYFRDLQLLNCSYQRIILVQTGGLASGSPFATNNKSCLAFSRPAMHSSTQCGLFEIMLI